METSDDFKKKELKIGVLNLRLFDPELHNMVILEAQSASDIISENMEDNYGVFL